MPSGAQPSHATRQMSIAKSFRPPGRRQLLSILVLVLCRSPQEALLTAPNNFTPLFEMGWEGGWSLSRRIYIY